jgi:hypothetical protein
MMNLLFRDWSFVFTVTYAFSPFPASFIVLNIIEINNVLFGSF